MSYAATHAMALRLAKKRGALCVVTKGATTYRGYATPDKPNVDQYAALGLNTKANVTLLWVPEVRGVTPPKGGTFAWSTPPVQYSVAEPNPYDPDSAGTLYCELIGTR